jgi:hypothetical protein
MDVPMDMEGRLENLDEPAKCLDPAVGQVWLVMDSARRRMGNQDI